jgi:hypothetical protein
MDGYIALCKWIPRQKPLWIRRNPLRAPLQPLIILQHSDFPYSSCRNVVIQITWWEALQDPSPQTLTLNTVIADPAYVFVANLNKGGAINFKPDCGANVSMDIDNSLSADISAIVSNTTSVYKAEQTWSSSQTR